MAHADGIAAHLLEHDEPSVPGILIPCCTKGTGVMMQAHAPEEGLHTVKIEAVRAEFGIPYAEGRLIHIPCVFCLNHRAGKIHLRILRAP